MNIVIIRGNVVDSEIKILEFGDKKLAKFSIGVNTKFSGGKAICAYFEVECWNRLAEIAKKNYYKGLNLIINGALKQNRWKDKKTNAYKEKITIIAQFVEYGTLKKSIDRNKKNISENEIIEHEAQTQIRQENVYNEAKNNAEEIAGEKYKYDIEDEEEVPF